MKKFFCSTHTLFLLLIVSTILNATTTTGEITLKAELYNNKERKPNNESTYEKSLQLNTTSTKIFTVSVDLTDDKNYIYQVLGRLKSQFSEHDFLFPWKENKVFELRALARTFFPITKECRSNLLIYVVKKDLLNKGLVSDPVKFFQKNENWKPEWLKLKTDLVAASEDTTRKNSGSDTSRTGNNEQKNEVMLLKCGGALIFVSLLARGGYALYRSVKLQKKESSENEEVRAA